MAGTLRLLFVAGGLLVCGTFNSLIAKLIYGIQAPGPSATGALPLEIPWGYDDDVERAVGAFSPMVFSWSPPGIFWCR